MIYQHIRESIEQDIQKFFLQIEKSLKIPIHRLNEEWLTFCVGESTPSTNNKKNVTTIVTPDVKQVFTFDDLNKKKMSELKDLCEKFGVKKSGNKSDLIKNILDREKKILPINPPEPVKNQIIDKTLDVFVSTSNEKRSKIENENGEEFDEIEDPIGFDDPELSDKYESDEETIQDLDEEEIDEDEDDGFLNDD
jgi:uncharacterized protein YunC (DUF1805 family)